MYRGFLKSIDCFLKDASEKLVINIKVILAKYAQVNSWVISIADTDLRLFKMSTATSSN